MVKQVKVSGERVIDLDANIWLVAAKGQPGLWHGVIEDFPNTLTCDCRGFTFHDRCRHVDAVAQLLRLESPPGVEVDRVGVISAPLGLDDASARVAVDKPAAESLGEISSALGEAISRETTEQAGAALDALWSTLPHSQRTLLARYEGEMNRRWCESVDGVAIAFYQLGINHGREAVPSNPTTPASARQLVAALNQAARQVGLDAQVEPDRLNCTAD